MIKIFHRIKWFLGLVLLQVLVFNQMHIGGYATPFFYIYFILKFNSRIKRNELALGSALIFLGLLSGCTASAQRHAEVLGAPAPCGQDDTAALQQALDRVSNGGVLVLGAGEYHVDGALCVPEKATLRAVQGALLCVGKEGSLTVNGRVQAGIYPIFAVEGQLQGSSPSTAYPQWFGAKGDGTTDDSRALEQAVRCFATVKLPETRDGGYVLDLESCSLIKNLYW